MNSDLAHSFHPTLLREYDARGIVDETLFEADALALGRAVGTTLVRDHQATRVAVGYDGRHSSPILEAALVEGLMSTGLHVVRVGLGPTPLLYFAVHEANCDGGIMITGSHNPPNYNGFKLVYGKKAAYGQQIYDLGPLAEQGNFVRGDGSEEKLDLMDRYVDRLVRDFTGDRDLKIAWDAGNGAAGEAMRRITDKLPGTHHLLFEEIDGNFPNHHPDPTVEKNLVDLKARVAEEGCDFGVAFDGDGDRLGVVDGQGRVLWGDQIMLLLARDVLTRHPGATLISDVKASQVLYDGIAELGGKPYMYKTGHSLIKAKMAELGSPFAGEMSAHIFFADGFYGHDDGLYAAIRLANALKVWGGTLASFLDSLPKLVNTPELRFNCTEERKFEVVEEVKTRLEAAGANVNAIDGVRVQTEDGWWLLRASNTQAVLVARCESKTQEGLERLKASLAEQIVASGLEQPDFDAENAGH
ncbi:phosphoglucomutase/phosphomannomutase PgmG [Rhodovibrionaceae bacterium A322]